MGIAKFTLSKIKSLYGQPKIKVPERFKPKFSIEGVEAYFESIAEENAQEFLELLISNIETNKYGYTLKPSTKKRKGRETPWIDTKELLNSIIRRGDTVGLKEGKHSGSNLTYEELAMVLEYGMKERGIPPRDVFRRTFQDFRKKAIENVEKKLK